jgi:hypothetical protein
MRCMPMRYNAHQMHAREVHAHEMHACETPAHKIHTRISLILPTPRVALIASSNCYPGKYLSGDLALKICP